MKKDKGVPIARVAEGGPAHRAGIRKGDALLAVNGHEINDVIDYMFHNDAPELNAAFLRDGRRLRRKLKLGGSEGPGMELGHFRTKTCRNKCIFCFVMQLPKGLRRPLYVKDEDYRMSFLYGNYVTLTNLSAEDRERIARQRLSPLYISVHSTDDELRRKMLGNPNAPGIMEELHFFAENQIRMHIQIVLCPGINDGKALRNTLNDLKGLYPYVSSVAVVPVGLTAHRKIPLRPVGRADAERALDAIEAYARVLKKQHGEPLVYGSDELYIKAGRPFPPLSHYGDLPQIENGVGMVPLFLSEAKKIFKSIPHPRKLIPLSEPVKRYLTFTGASFYPYLAEFLMGLGKKGLSITPVKVENDFFGHSVTVTGLLTGGDVIKTLSGKTKGFDMLLIPDCVLREGGEVFLDDVSVKEIESALGIKAVVIESTPEGIIRIPSRLDKQSALLV